METEKTKWFTLCKNIRYKKHPTRRNGIKYDRYFSGYYSHNKKMITIGFGWESGGWTESLVKTKIDIYIKNVKLGLKPTTLKEEARSKELEREQIAKENDPDSPQNITFKRFYEKYYIAAAKMDKKKSTVIREPSYFKQWLLPDLGNLVLREINDSHLEKLKRRMIKKDCKPATIKQCLNLFNAVWRYATRRKIVINNSPAKIVVVSKIDNVCTRYFTPEETGKLLEKLKPMNINTHDMTLLSLHTGVRRGEIFDLKWSVIDFENKTINVRDAKGKSRHVYLTKQTIEMLERRNTGQKPFELVFTNADGKKYLQIPNSYKRSTNLLGFNKDVTDRRDVATFHTCRHTFASWYMLFVEKPDLYKLSKLMGHGSIAVTQRYAHLAPGGLKAAAAHFDDAIENL